MFILRFVGSWSIVLGLVALVADLTQAMTSGATVAFTSLGRHWQALSPTTLASVQAALERSGYPMLWDPALVGLLRLPSFAVLFGLGVLLFVVARRRRRTDIFAN